MKEMAVKALFCRLGGVRWEGGGYGGGGGKEELCRGRGVSFLCTEGGICMQMSTGAALPG